MFGLEEDSYFPLIFSSVQIPHLRDSRRSWAAMFRSRRRRGRPTNLRSLPPDVVTPRANRRTPSPSLTQVQFLRPSAFMHALMSEGFLSNENNHPNRSSCSTQLFWDLYFCTQSVAATSRQKLIFSKKYYFNLLGCGSSILKDIVI